MGKLLMIAGAVLFLVGLLVMYGPKIPFLGRLPGDIVIRGEGGNFYFPIVTCIVLSVLGSIILNLISRR
ncbi:MAG: DUF2905 domain-containing protein [bacterium]|nr:DUF2905 domain-containing protein [bacterium]